ncbi:MAG: hypothetical protein WD008_00605 [Balneolaceae bacterium]
MFKLFIRLNTRLWWRSLKGAEFAAIIFYTLFLLLVLSQVIVVAVSLLFVQDIALVREQYPWFTEEVQLAFQLLLINSIWTTQIFFTKVSRLRIHENRKLLALGLPIKKLTMFLNGAGFFHPINVMFHLIWIVYLGLMASELSQYLVVGLFIVANYGIISSFKWKFQLVSKKYLTWINVFLSLILVTLIIGSPYINLQSILNNTGQLTGTFLLILHFTPGGIIYALPNLVPFGFEQIIAVSSLLIMIFLTNHYLIRRTQLALLTPTSSTSQNDQVSRLSFFTKWMGIQGGKYIFNVWNHSYTKTQLIISFFIPAFYIITVSDHSAAGDFMVAMFLSLVPAFILMLLVTNLFGFENRELLLSLQSPVSLREIVHSRIYSALKVVLVPFIFVLLFVPVFFRSVPGILQITFAIALVCQFIFLFVIKSSINNYKKIENIGLMSVSNPVVPAYITFTCMFIIVLIGVISFIEFGRYQWIHIALLALANAGLAVHLYRKINRIEKPFKLNVLPQLWNEL